MFKILFLAACSSAIIALMKVWVRLADETGKLAAKVTQTYADVRDNVKAKCTM